MKLFIAEKPSLAQAIAHGLGHMKRQNGYIECGDSIVTWCFGHIMEQYRPEDYDEKYKPWRMEDLPILPTQWKLKVKNDCKDQFNIIKGLVGKADTIVNAGDPDREGQLLIDEVLNYIGVLGKKPIQRILLNALDDKSVKETLVNLQDNEKFVGLRNSALARSRRHEHDTGIDAPRTQVRVYRCRCKCRSCPDSNHGSGVPPRNGNQKFPSRRFLPAPCGLAASEWNRAYLLEGSCGYRGNGRGRPYPES